MNAVQGDSSVTEWESSHTVVRGILQGYRHTVDLTNLESLGSAGGWSGAEFWRVTTAGGLFCLRRWPREHPSEPQLAAIHRVLLGVYERGVVEVAVPLRDVAGQTMARADGSLWELTRWMPGSADYSRFPSPARLTSALQLLARFHRVTDDMTSGRVGPPIGIERRAKQLQWLMEDGVRELRRAVQRANNREVTEKFSGYATHFLDLFAKLAPEIGRQLDDRCRDTVPSQPCIRDIWHDHVLFSGDSATGLIDFGALREDHVASDISRLLGSLVQNDRAGWQQGLAAYEGVRPLSAVDRQLITVYDRSAILLSAMNWLQWLYIDGRRFDNEDRVLLRMAEIRSRLAQLDASGAVLARDP